MEVKLQQYQGLKDKLDRLEQMLSVLLAQPPNILKTTPAIDPSTSLSQANANKPLLIPANEPFPPLPKVAIGQGPAIKPTPPHMVTVTKASILPSSSPTQADLIPSSISTPLHQDPAYHKWQDAQPRQIQEPPKVYHTTPALSNLAANHGRDEELFLVYKYQ
jgi:hypothetical protein